MGDLFFFRAAQWNRDSVFRSHRLHLYHEETRAPIYAGRAVLCDNGSHIRLRANHHHAVQPQVTEHDDGNKISLAYILR